MKIKTMAFREVYNLFVDVWELYRKYGARRLDDAECEAMTREADAINEKYQSDLGRNENSILEMITIIKEYAERNGEEPVDVFNKILGEGVNGNEE